VERNRLLRFFLCPFAPSDFDVELLAQIGHESVQSAELRGTIAGLSDPAKNSGRYRAQG
jgi:hypothetical protein